MCTPEDPSLSQPISARRRGRPKSQLLSRQLIVATAVDLARTSSSADATVGVRAVAAQLGVKPSALYNHVDGHTDMIDGVRDAVCGQLPTESFATLPWPEALEVWALHYQASFAAHPQTVAELATQPFSADAETTVMYDKLVAALEAAGWPIDRVLSLIVAVESFVLGSVLDHAADDDMFDPGNRTDVPNFRRAYEARAARIAAEHTRNASDAFHFGLHALIAGLQKEHARFGAADAESKM